MVARRPGHVRSHSAQLRANHSLWSENASLARPTSFLDLTSLSRKRVQSPPLSETAKAASNLSSSTNGDKPKTAVYGFVGFVTSFFAYGLIIRFAYLVSFRW